MKNKALEYLSSGVSVIPIKANDKRPLIDWKPFQDRLPEEAEIIEWWTKHPNANVGIVTGAISGLVVIDVDAKNGGLETLKRLNIPPTPTVKTGGGGYHFYFRHPGGTISNKTGFLPGVDLRADGGLIVAPPSVHESGNPYQWEVGRNIDVVPLADLPEWVLSEKDTRKNSIKELYTGVSEGSRNDAIARLVGSFINDGATTMEECLEMALTCNATYKPPLPAEEIEATVRSIWSRHQVETEAKKQGTRSVEVVEDVSIKLFPSRAFPLEIFPEELQGLIRKIAVAYCVPVETVASAMLAIASAAIGNSTRVSVKESWEEPVFLWVMVVGRSGSGKSPVIGKLLGVVISIQSNVISQYNDEKIQYEFAMIEYKADEEKYKANFKKGKTAIRPTKPTEPELKHYVISDTTIEALGNAMASSPRGVLMHNDELAGFVKSHDQYKGEGADRQKYLELWNAKPWKIDRATKGSKFIRDTGTSILGGIQPLIMPTIFNEFSFSDGLLPRFLITVMEGPIGGFSMEEITSSDIRKWEELVCRLYGIELKKTSSGVVSHNIISFSEEAKEIFSRFHKSYTDKSRFLPEKAAVFIPKLTSYAVRLSGILHLIGDGGSQIEAKTVEDAIKLTDYFAGQAMRAMKFYTKSRSTSKVEVELVQTLFGMKGTVRHGKLHLAGIVTALNDRLPEFVKQTPEAVSRLLRKMGLNTKLVGGYSQLVWDAEGLGKLFSTHISPSTTSTTSTESLSTVEDAEVVEAPKEKQG